MRCPFCGFEDTQVKDSRPSEDNAAIRRRRFCPECDARFTTFERVQLRELVVVKNDGSKKPFDRDKLARSMRIALRKRPVDEDKLDQLINSLVRQMETTGDGELTTKEIGQMVMDTLRHLDHVAYVRYASVYRDFRSPADFNEFVETLKHDAPIG
jgi:transcriptional repressor NrdR